MASTELSISQNLWLSVRLNASALENYKDTLAGSGSTTCMCHHYLSELLTLRLPQSDALSRNRVSGSRRALTQATHDDIREAEVCLCC